MFLALDESIDNPTKIIGCVCFPINMYGEFEKTVAEFRATKRMWSELKWNKLNEQYADRYIEFIKIFSDKPDVTFHTWAYEEVGGLERSRIYGTRDKGTIFYKNTYSLIRSVIRKAMKSGITQFYILADETGTPGRDNFKLFNEMLSNDSRLRGANVLYCATAKSTMSGTLQLADLITGAVSQGCYGTISDPGKIKVYNHFLEVNENIDLDITTISVPSLTDTRVHHCNIDEYYRLKPRPTIKAK
jgi:hypothetical protein